MLSYLKGAGSSLIVAIIIYVYFIINLPEHSGMNLYHKGIAVIFVLNYLGCLFGWGLRNILLRYDINNFLVGILLYAILGAVFVFILSAVIPTHSILYLMAITGSVVYYLVQNEKVSQWFIITLGPIIALVFYIHFSSINV